VFISHKKEDTDACRPIADYILQSGSDVFFDVYDETLSDLVTEGNPDKVTARIQEGIDYSTHMLCVVSPQTVHSYWVPFEVGYGYSKVQLGVLTLKGIEDTALPDYMRTVNVVRGTKSLNEFIVNLLGRSEATLLQERVIKSNSQLNHPLDGVLEWRR
jgi:hypothetical protein